MNCKSANLFCYKPMILSLILKELSSWFIIIKVLKRKKPNFGKFIKPLTIVSLNNFAWFETYPGCHPNNRIFTITKPDPVNTERLARLSVTAVRHDMPFNKNRFFIIPSTTAVQEECCHFPTSLTLSGRSWSAADTPAFWRSEQQSAGRALKNRIFS